MYVYCAACIIMFPHVCLLSMNDACVHARVLILQEPKDTLCVCLVYGLVWLVDVLHGDGVGELVEHPLLESLQPLVVMAAAHKLLVLQRGGRGGQRWG